MLKKDIFPNFQGHSFSKFSEPDFLFFSATFLRQINFFPKAGKKLVNIKVSMLVRSFDFLNILVIFDFCAFHDHLYKFYSIGMVSLINMYCFILPYQVAYFAYEKFHARRNCGKKML